MRYKKKNYSDCIESFSDTSRKILEKVPKFSERDLYLNARNVSWSLV